MGVLDIFLSKDKRVQKARDKNIQRTADKYRPSPDRMRAMEALLEDGSEEALVGLLRRFGMKYDKSIDDEQEKEWVCDVLINKGQAVLPALRRYLKSAESATWPLRVLTQVASSRDEELQILEEVLARHEPGYERDPSKKIQLLNHLAGLKHDRAPELAAPYLEDMDEGVRFAAAEALLRHKNEDVAREKLLALFVSDQEESLRLRKRIAQGFVDCGWLVRGFRAEVEKKLPAAYTLDREGHFKQKPGADRED